MRPPEYILDLFEAQDRIAIVAISRSEERVLQRILDAGEAAGDRVQGWLRHLNARPQDPGQGFPGRPYDVFVGMNRLHPHATGRTKADVAEVRHVFMDIDHNGREAIDKVFKHPALEPPSYVLASSPGKYQAVWKVKDFTPERAETLSRNMVREFGADPARIDISSVLRLPGFRNQKYDQTHWVKVESHSREVFTPDAFPRELFAEQRDVQYTPERGPREPWAQTQSERDWGYAMRHLRLGESPDQVEAAIAKYRRDRGDKQYPEAYAKRTVERARLAVEREYGRSR